MPSKTVIDIDGSEAVSKILLDLLNKFPGLTTGNKSILFSTLSDASGIGFFPISGAALQNSTEDVTGHVTQVCQYPFNVVYRAAPKSETQRIRIKEFLDALGKWLERQPVTLNGKSHQLSAYPALLAGNRVIKKISRTSPAYNKITLANGAGNQPVRLAYKEQTIFNAVLPVPSGVLPGSSDNVQRSYFITDEKGNKIVTPEGYYLVWDTDANMAKKVSLQAGVINIPVVCGEITTGTQITVTGVTLNSDSGESYTAGNDNGTMLTIDSNPYATQGICNDLYTAFNGLVYLPFTATKSLYDPATELGDQVKIGELVHSVMFNVKLTLDHNFRADIEAPNSEELSEEYPYLSEVQHLKQTTEELNGAIQNAAKELAGKVDDTALTAEIERAQGVEVALNERIGREETRAKGAEDGLSKRIKSIEDSSPGALAQRVSALETTVSGHTQSISALNTAISGHASDISQLVQRVQNAEGDIDALQSTVDGHTTALSEVQGTVTDLQTRLTTAEGTVASHDTAISTLQTKVSNIEAALIDIYNRLNALDSGGTGT